MAAQGLPPAEWCRGGVRVNVPVSILVAGGLIAFTIWTQEVNNRADQACYHLWRSIPSEIIAATALILASGLRVSGVNSAHLGWMSAQWLAEYRAAQRTQ